MAGYCGQHPFDPTKSTRFWYWALAAAVQTKSRKEKIQGAFSPIPGKGMCPSFVCPVSARTLVVLWSPLQSGFDPPWFDLRDFSWCLLWEHPNDFPGKFAQCRRSAHSIERKSQREWLTMRNGCAFGKRSKAPVLIRSPGGLAKERGPRFWLNPHFPALPASSVAFYTCLRGG